MIITPDEHGPATAALAFDAGITQEPNRIVELAAVEDWELDPEQIWARIRKHGAETSPKTWTLSAVWYPFVCGVMISEPGAERTWRERWVFASEYSEVPASFRAPGNAYATQVSLGEALASAVEIIKRLEENK